MVENNPNVLNGVLVFVNTRVPVRNLFDYLVAGDTVKDFLEDFPTVSFEQITQMVQNGEIVRVP